jgi:hypothetical protein
MKKVYELSWNSIGYGNGLCIVAADSPEEAVDFAQQKDNRWDYPQLINGLSYEGDSGVITFKYYQE